MYVLIIFLGLIYVAYTSLDQSNRNLLIDGDLINMLRNCNFQDSIYFFMKWMQVPLLQSSKVQVNRI